MGPALILKYGYDNDENRFLDKRNGNYKLKTIELHNYIVDEIVA